SLGVCYEGGLDAQGKPADTRTPRQKRAMQELLDRLKKEHPDAVVVGHRDLPGVKKDCPCYNV
ncbi:MAG: N-acetylmuramoyl-L-alanine amidase, partial [Prevotella sp.]|nr:N-acetylmuramoyl-L-alanine amidase [Prevotella sp.]